MAIIFCNVKMNRYKNKRCFICLRLVNSLKGEKCLKYEQENFSLRNICQLLKVKDEAIKLFNEDPHNSDVKVSLCENCMKIGSKLSELYLNLEKIYLETDYYVGELHNRISKGCGSGVATNLLENRGIGLREELKQKCSSKRFSSVNLKAELNKWPKAVNTAAPVSPIPVPVGEIKIENVSNDADFQDEAEINFSVSPFMEEIEELPSTIKNRPVSSKRRRGRPPTFEIGRTVNGKNKCPSCDKEYNQLVGARVHYQNVHLQKNRKCNICGSFYSLTTSIIAHQATCKGINKNLVKKNLAVVELGTHFTVLNDPLSNCQQKKYKCTACNKEYKGLQHIRAHFRDVHITNDCKCDKCGFHFSSKISLAVHQTKCDGVKKQILMKKRESYKFVCNICSKKFLYNANLKQHYKSVHLKLRSYSCDMCGKTFTTVSNLTQHKSGVHFKKSFEKLQSVNLLPVREENFLLEEDPETEMNEVGVGIATSFKEEMDGNRMEQGEEHVSTLELERAWETYIF